MEARARGDIDPNSGIDFVTITHPNNAPWPGTNPPTPGDSARGRGSVPYEYRIGKYEVTSAQWVEFMNAAFDRPAGDAIPFVQSPRFWGGRSTTPTNTSNPNARRWSVVPGGAMLPTGTISWRTAAIYCNWLTNDKSLTRDAFLSGAYDVSTFGFTPGGRFTDQLTRSPGAKYFIPSWDEWIKAAHYDVNKLNADGSRGGWWQYSNGSDQPWTAGPPANFLPSGDPRVGTANYGWTEFTYPDLNNLDPFAVQLGWYPHTSPFGLFDVAGATAEWTEEARFAVPGDLPTSRIYDGSWWGSNRGVGGADRIFDWSSEVPNIAFIENGLRVAAVLPAPSMCCLFAGVLLINTVRRRRS